MDDRRRFLCRAGVMAGSLIVPACATWAAQKEKSEKKEEEEVTPTEDLMREHGLLNRILLIYDESRRRLEGKGDLDLAILSSAAEIIRNFIEDYHEKLEEQYLFPRFEKAGKLTDLVAVLKTQHEAGRKVTARILQLATRSADKDAAQRRDLADQLRLFNRMYRPHEAREDTVLFPALHQIVSRNEFDSLGEQFEKREHELFGEDGFEHMVDRVAGLEKSLGIYDLAQFTPK
jgi:hemerythrin-like domain-containing protein